MKFNIAALTLFVLLATAISMILAQQKNEENIAGRFDNVVREEFFAGMAGDSASFTRAMKLCEERLAIRPRDPEAMVWHGAGVYFQAGQAFRSGDRETGMRLSTEGMQQMNDAVELSPSLQTLIPRGAMLLAASKRISDPQVRKATLQQGVADFERVLELDKTFFPERCQHAKGELLGGLAEGWYRLGDPQKANVYLKRILAELPKTRYAEAANSLLQDRPSPDQVSLTCKGCHVAEKQ